MFELIEKKKMFVSTNLFSNFEEKALTLGGWSRTEFNELYPNNQLKEINLDELKLEIPKRKVSTFMGSNTKLTTKDFEFLGDILDRMMEINPKKRTSIDEVLKKLEEVS